MRWCVGVAGPLEAQEAQFEAAPAWARRRGRGVRARRQRRRRRRTLRVERGLPGLVLGDLVHRVLLALLALAVGLLGLGDVHLRAEIGDA